MAMHNNSSQNVCYNEHWLKVLLQNIQQVVRFGDYQVQMEVKLSEVVVGWGKEKNPKSEKDRGFPQKIVRKMVIK